MLAQEFSRSGVKGRVNAIAPGICIPSEITAGGSDEANKSHRSAEGLSILGEIKTWHGLYYTLQSINMPMGKSSRWPEDSS